MPAPTVDDLIDMLQEIKPIEHELTRKALDMILRAIVALHEVGEEEEDEE